MYNTLKYEVADNILTLTLNRPDRMNAVTTEMLRELVDVFDHSDADDNVRAIVVTGAGRAFSAGADLSSGSTFDYTSRKGGTGFENSSPIREDGSIDWSHEGIRDGGGRVALRIFDSLKPVIAAVNGAAAGFGATMLLPMDIRLASTEARFGFVFSRRGIVSEAASSWFLPRVVGISQALEWTYTGRVFDAQEAFASRLVRGLYRPDELLPAAYALAREIVDNSAPVSVSLIRQAMWKMLGADHPMEAHKIDSKLVYWRGASADAKEGVRSFLEKRTPNFPNKVSSDMPPCFPWWQARKYS